VVPLRWEGCGGHMGTREEARGLAAAQRLPNQMLNVNTEEILPQEMDAFSGRTHSSQPAPARVPAIGPFPQAAMVWLTAWGCGSSHGRYKPSVDY